MNRKRIEEMVRIHQNDLYRYIRYLGADREDAEDLMQETFIAALRSGMPKLTGNNARGAWLRGIARNIFISHWRRKRRNPISSINTTEEFWQKEFLRGGDGSDYIDALRVCLR